MFHRNDEIRGLPPFFPYDPRKEMTGFRRDGAVNANGTVTAGYNVGFNYDNNGNRTTVNESCCVASYTTVPTNQYMTDQTGNLNYDNNANLTGRGEWVYTYDQQNRLTSIDKAG